MLIFDINKQNNERRNDIVQSIEAVYKAHAQTVYRFLLSLTHDRNLAEEMTQETFYQAVRCIEHYDGSSKLSTWLCSIAKNQLYTYHKKHPSQQTLDDISTTVPSAESDYFSSINKIELLKCLHNLTDPMREVMYLRLFGDLSFREIGDILAQTENWARVTYYRGKEKLLKEIKLDE
jgi:RNA polymerase sigma-70 factor (ECF subfamily)